MCTVHGDKDLEYYCGDHDVMACGACVNTDHRRCDRVLFIKDITDGPTDRKTVADAAVEMRDIRKNIEDIQKDTGEIVTSLEQQRNEIRERRDQYRNRIMTLLDTIDTSSELEMEQLIQSVSQDMGDDSQSSKEVLSQIDSSIQILDATVGHATDKQMFVVGRRSTADRDRYLGMLNNAMGSVHNVRLEFKPDSTLERLAKSLELFDGRTISSTRTRHDNKNSQRNVFEPQTGFVDHQASVYASRSDFMRGGTGGETTTMHSYNHTNPNVMSMQQGHEMSPRSYQSSLMSGSVPDFGSAGFRSSASSDAGSKHDLYSPQRMRSQPQSPRRYDYGNQYQTRSVPQTPLMQQHIQSTRAQTSQDAMFYDRQMRGKEVLPMISPRGVHSEQAYFDNQRATDFPPMSPRTVGNNALIDKGLASRSNISLLTTTASLKRRESMNSAASLSNSIKSVGKPDPLNTVSSIKPRSELNPVVTALKERKAILVGQFNVRLPEDSHVCGLKGATFLQDGRIILADYDNQSVKLFDSKLYRGDHLRLSSGPWDVAVTGKKEVAVTLPFESKIQFVSISETIKATRAIKMEMDCYGLVCRDQELIVVCNDYLIGPAVQVVSLTGRVKQTIDTDRNGSRILSDPYYLTVTQTGKLIYVADKDRIVCMDRHGNVASVYQDTSLCSTRGIDMDNEGNLYVCGYMSNNVYQITMHGIDFRCLMNKEEVYDPWSVKFNENNGTIMITCDASDTIKVFSLQ